MTNEILPIGSVVLLKQGIKKLMIIAIKTAPAEEPERVFDYMGVVYPEGYLGKKSLFLFNHEDINDIIYRGYENPEREEFMRKFNEIYSEKDNNKDNNETGLE